MVDCLEHCNGLISSHKCLDCGFKLCHADLFVAIFVDHGNEFIESVTLAFDVLLQLFLDFIIAELKELCDELITSRDKDKAMELLPPVQGFFFGNDNVDDNYYWQSLKYTSEMIADILSRPQLAHFDFHYSSSW